MAETPYLIITDTVRVATSDSADTGDAPDAVPSWNVGMEVVFIPKARDMTLAATGERHEIDNITGVYDSDGVLRRYAVEDSQGAISSYGPAGVVLPDLTSPEWLSPFNADEASWGVQFTSSLLPNAGKFTQRGGPIRPGYEGETRLGALLPQAVVNGVPVVGGMKGRGIESTSVDDGSLVVVYDDETTENAGLLPTEPGPPGPPGPDTQGFYTQKIQPYATNLILNPRLNTAAAWSKTTGTSFDTTGVNGVTLTDTNANGNEFVYPVLDNNCVPGETFSEGAFFTLTSNPATSAANGRCTYIFLNSSNAIISTVNGPVVALTGAPKQRVTFTQTAPPNATKVRALFYAVNMTGGATVRVQQAMLVSSATLPEYFDGTTPLAVWSGTPDNSTSLQLFPAAAEYNALKALPAKVTTPPISLTKVGTSHAITSQLGGQDLVIQTSKSTSNNGSFDLDPGTTLGGNPIWQGVNTGDDIAPIQMPSGFIGGDHGFANLASFANPDAKGTNELGSVWTDGTREYLLAQITGGRLVMMGSYTKTAGVVTWAKVEPTTNLTFVSGGANATKTAPIVYTTRDGTQMWPSTMKQLVDYRADNKQVTADGTYSGTQITTRETYDVMAYDSVYDLMKANPGVPYTSLPVLPQVRVSNAFRWVAGGLCLVTGSLQEIAPATLQPTGGMQSYPPFVAGGTRTRYLPGVGVVGGVDWTAGADVSTPQTSQPTTINITAADAPQGAPFSLDVIKLNGVVQFGWAIGYLPFGNRGDETSRDSARFTSPTSVIWQMNTSTKIYPYFAARAAGWGRLTFDGFRAFLTPEQVAQVLAVKGSASAAWAALDACKNISRTAQ